MKSKGTSVWEQYIEFVVLGIAALVLCWFAWGALTSKIEHRQGSRVVTTGNIDDELLKVANTIRPKLQDGTPSPVDVSTYSSLLDSFNNRLQASTAPSRRVIFPDVDMTSEIDANQEVEAELRLYVTPDIDAPQDIQTQQWFGTIADSEFERVEALETVVEGPPHDTTWVQVAASFDVDEVVAAFTAATESVEAIPSQWFDEGADIFDIVLERQTLSESGWSAAEMVEVLPGHLTYRSDIETGNIDAMERETIIRLLRGGSQSEIANPDFYELKGVKPTTLQTPWLWDGEIVIEDGPTSELERDLKRIDKRIEQQEKRIVILQERIAKENERGRGGGGGGGSPLGGGGSPGAGGKNNAKIARLEAQLQRSHQDLVAFQDEKIAIELEIQQIEDEANSVEEVIMTGDVWIWAHDMDAVPGETYRYRMAVQVANPFFGHKPSLYPEQKPLADSVVMSSAKSEWTPSIEIQKPLQWFVLTATQSGQSISPDALDSGRVSAEIFEFKDGVWTSNVIGVPVGQRLAQPRADGFVSDWFVLDILEDVAGEIVLLQNVDDSEISMIKPFEVAMSQRLAQLRQQVKNQPTEEEEEDDSGMDPFNNPPRGGGGGGAGGGGAF